MRRLLLCIDDTARKVSKLPLCRPKELTDLAKWRKDLTATAEYAPTWVIVSIALALGCGTMVGWRSYRLHVGEKIGSSGMTYSQGIAAQSPAAASGGGQHDRHAGLHHPHPLLRGGGYHGGEQVRACRPDHQDHTAGLGADLPLTMLLSGGLFIC